jgi:hypothetical protein
METVCASLELNLEDKKPPGSQKNKIFKEVVTMTKTNEVLRGALSKDLKKVTFTLDISDIDWRNPSSITSKGNASYIFNQKYEFEVVDEDGITVPLNASIGLYMSKKNWKSYTEQVEGHEEGKKEGTNTVGKTYTADELSILKEKGLISEDIVKELILAGKVIL